MKLYPLFADLADRTVLVVGGGEVAARKSAALLRAGARIRVGAPVLHAQFSEWAAQGRLIHLPGGRLQATVLGPDDLGVEAQAGVEGEVPVVGQAQADLAVVALGQRLEQLPGRVDRVGRQAQGPDEHVGAPARQRGQGGRLGARRRAAQQPVDGLVDGAVTA